MVGTTRLLSRMNQLGVRNFGHFGQCQPHLEASKAHDLFTTWASEIDRTLPNFFFFIFEFYFIYFFIQQVLISHQFYTHQCIHVNPNRPIHHTTTTPPLSPLGVHTFVLYICVSISALQTGSSVPFSRFHIYALIYAICFSLSDLLHSV